MNQQRTPHPGDEWVPALEGWRQFVTGNPILGLKPGQWQLINAMRHSREELVRRDAARKINGRFWVFHRERIPLVMFDILSGAIQRGRARQRIADESTD